MHILRIRLKYNYVKNNTDNNLNSVIIKANWKLLINITDRKKIYDDMKAAKAHSMESYFMNLCAKSNPYNKFNI